MCESSYFRLIDDFLSQEGGGVGASDRESFQGHVDMDYWDTRWMTINDLLRVTFCMRKRTCSLDGIIRPLVRTSVFEIN